MTNADSSQPTGPNQAQLGANPHNSWILNPGEPGLLQSYIDIVGVMMVALDTSGQVIMINQRGCDLLGYSQTELLGKDWFETCLPQGIRNPVRAVFRQQIRGELEHTELFENAVLTNSGETRLVHFHNALLRSPDGSVQGVLCSGEDITERRKFEIEIQLRNRELALLNKVLAATSTSLDIEHILLSTLKELTQAIGLPQAGVALLTDDNQHLRVVAEYPPNTENSTLGELIPLANNLVTLAAIETKRPRAVVNAMEDDTIAPAHHLVQKRKTASILIVPMIVRDRVIGTIGLESRKRRVFTETEIILAANVSAAISQAIDNAHLHAEVQRMATTDELTGLYNRRGLFELGRREVRRAQRYGRPLSAVLVDLDKFKEVNDTYGHDAGDLVLKTLAANCLSRIRDIDIAGRLGGDEFVILLTETDAQSGLLLAERLRRCVSSGELHYHEHKICISISVGIAQLTDQMTDLEDLVRAADAAMYQAKQSGRNRTALLTGGGT